MPYHYRTNVNSGLIVVRWNDNKVVTVASDYHDVNPITFAKRWSAAKMQ